MMQKLLVFSVMVVDMCACACVSRKGTGVVATWGPHSPKSLEHICSMRPSALCSISHWAQILVTVKREAEVEAREAHEGIRVQ